MVETLRSVLDELACFGAEHDAGDRPRHEKMLNIAPETGEFLNVLVCASRARRVLEIGTSNGYSTLWLAEAARSLSGTVVTVEHSPLKADMARRNIERAGVTACVRQVEAEGGSFLSQQAAESFELLFLDADRKQYVGWWPAIQRVLTAGGLMVVDNAVSHAAELAEFMAQVRAAAGWRSVVVPIGKGEFIAVKPAA